jgi:hypothetical protein
MRAGETEDRAPTRDNLAPLYQSGQRPTRQHLKRPVDPATGQPMPPRDQPGYYPGFSTLGQQAFWDEATRTVVLDRVNNVPPVRFFSPEEARLLEAVCARILPQDDRAEATRIPIVPRIDQRLHDGVTDGYRYADTPPDGEVFQLGLQGIQAVAQHLARQPFEALDPLDQDIVLRTLHDGNPPAGEAYWDRVPVLHFWQLLVQDVIEAYYAHPYAWDEIGFGGPAYPRGYMRLEHGQPEPWEAPERRYVWAAPPASLSDAYAPIGKDAGPKTPTPGQEGTH